jgi:hypothetical protein
LSDKIHPSELAVPFAKGYSFPSGHSSMSSSVLGGVAYLLRKKRFICIFLICLILMIGFSRLWLGVHTPQDVVVGLTIGLTLIFVVNKIINWAEQNSNRYLWLALIVNIVIAFIIIYIRYFNTYRMDYIQGELLVDPVKTIYVTTVIYGYLLGLLNGCFLCRRFFPFNPKNVSVKNRVITGIIGGIVIVLMLKCIIGHIIMNVLSLAYSFPVMFICGIFITLIYPIIFQNIDKSYQK